MAGKVFVDSNVLICAHDRDAGVKHQRAAEQLRELWENGLGRLSTQALEEFYVNVMQKSKKPLARSVAREVIRNYGLWVESAITPFTVVRASEISEAMLDLIVSGAKSPPCRGITTWRWCLV